MVPREVISAVLDRIILPDLIGQHIKLRPGQNGALTGLCPFHDESTPSFVVYRDHFHCFGCGAHGTAIDFLMKKEGTRFPEVLRQLAERTGITIDEGKQERDPDPHWILRKTLRTACAAWQNLLFSSDGEEAVRVLEGRGIDLDTITRFGIGYAPAGDVLSGRSFKTPRRISWNDLLAAGVAVYNKSGKSCRDFFRERIIFPVTDGQGSIVGFGGRYIGQDEKIPKYLNTRETAIYKKGEQLFGLSVARPAIQKTREVILCEGYFDVIMPSQEGIEQIISTCGTAFGETQARQVLALADRIFLCFDGDEAGRKATWRAARILADLMTDKHEVRICRLPEGHDPDSLVREEGVAAMRTVLTEALYLTNYLIETLTRGANVPERKAQSLMLAQEYFASFGNAPVIAELFQKDLRKALSLSKAVVKAKMSGQAPN